MCKRVTHVVLWQARAKTLKLPCHVTVDAGRTQISPSMYALLITIIIYLRTVDCYFFLLMISVETWHGRVVAQEIYRLVGILYFGLTMLFRFLQKKEGSCTY